MTALYNRPSSFFWNETSIWIVSIITTICKHTTLYQTCGAQNSSLNSKILLSCFHAFLSTYNPGQNYLRIFTPPCTLSNVTTLFQQQLICGTKFPSPQVNVVSYKCLRIRVALEHTTTLLPRGGGKGGRSIARMLAKMVWECDIFSTVLSKIVDIPYC